MKHLSKIFLLAALIIMSVSCGIDNYDKPSSLFTGKVVYNGQPLGVSGSKGDVFLQFWQDGYQLHTSFNVYVTQDGSFSAMLFDGTYKLVMNSNRGPWVNSPDTVIVNVKGNTTQDYPVKPYFTLSNITYNKNGNTLTASFDITQINSGKTIEYVALMVNKTQFVDFAAETHVNWVKNTSVIPGHVTMQLDITNDLSKQVKLYARVGLKISGIDQGLFDTGVYEVK